MQIGQFVKRHVAAILDHCATADPAEFARLQDPRWSKAVFDINYPFCTPVTRISAADQVRYYRQEYVVQGVRVRVCSQWYNPPISKSQPFLLRYLHERGIEVDGAEASATDPATTTAAATRAARGRYKASAIGNAQNALVRNLLGRLGEEQFSAADWERVVAEFDHRCAYCGAEGLLEMDHVVSLNKQALGEHRLGNLVPACKACNAAKSEEDYRDFLGPEQQDRILAIEAHMARHGYTAQSDNVRLRQILELAHGELRQLADRYVAILAAARDDEQRGT